MSYQSMTDIAYNVLAKKKKGLAFSEVWGQITETLNLDTAAQQKKIAQFYTEMMLDNRFISLEDNQWDLRSRHSFNRPQVEAIDLDDDEDEYDEFDESDDEEIDEKKNKDE